MSDTLPDIRADMHQLLSPDEDVFVCADKFLIRDSRHAEMNRMHRSRDARYVIMIEMTPKNASKYAYTRRACAWLVCRFEPEEFRCPL